MNIENPLRYPDVSSAEFMSRRGWWLLLVGVLVPGSAQAIAGNKKLGRLGLISTMSLWTVSAFLVTWFFLNRGAFLGFVSLGWVLWLLQLVMIYFALLWIVLLFDTLRITRLVKIPRQSRIGLVATSLITMTAVIVGATYFTNVASASRNALGSIFVATGPTVDPIDGRYNILLLGGDAGADREGLRADSISLVSVNAETGQSVIVGLPRELQYMPFRETSPMFQLHPGGYATTICEVDVCYLNSIYTDVSINHPEYYPNAVSEASEPGIEAIKDAVTGATGLEVQFYVLVDMAGFESLIDALGGVEVNVLDRLPIGGDQYGNNVDGFIEPGVQTLNGYNALWYARSRYSTDDYDRMRRQRELQGAILAQFTPANVSTRFVQLASAGSALIRTDIPESMFPTFVNLAVDARNYPPVTVELTPPTVDPFFPDYAAIQQLITDAVDATSQLPDPTPSS